MIRLIDALLVLAILQLIWSLFGMADSTDPLRTFAVVSLLAILAAAGGARR